MSAYSVGEKGVCPHCGVVVKFYGHKDGKTQWIVSKSLVEDESVQEGERFYEVTAANCPNCDGLVLALGILKVLGVDFGEPEIEILVSPSLIYPRALARPVAEEVPDHIAADYREAAQVLSISPKASAALSRRCLQSVLAEAGQASQGNLSRQIDHVLAGLPSNLAKQLDAIRNIGNFAAHPMKSQSSGEIVEVEPGEAEWNLDVLDLLFDHFYVLPARIDEMTAALNAKLQDAGRPPMKGSPTQ